jgi:hypothetical protein
MEKRQTLMIDVVTPSLFQMARYKETTPSDVSDLRQRLLALGVWPEAGDEFLALLPGSRWHSPPLVEEDKEWLLMVAQDALRGRDIGSNYPAFFQKLITNANLRQAFLEELDRLPAGNPGSNSSINGVLKQ